MPAGAPLRSVIGEERRGEERGGEGGRAHRSGGLEELKGVESIEHGQLTEEMRGKVFCSVQRGKKRNFGLERKLSIKNVQR